MFQLDQEYLTAGLTDDASRLDFLIQWPQREELRKIMPLVFRQNFGLQVALITLSAFT